MRATLFWIFSCLVIISCKKEIKQPKVEVVTKTPEITVNVERFDKLFFETPVKNFPELEKKFPYLFPKNFPNSVWIEKSQDPIWREVYTEVQKKYSNIEPVRKECVELFGNIKKYYPAMKIPKVITLISEMDYQTKTIYTDSIVLISLELYLGKDHKFYQFPKYLKENFTERQMMPDVVSSFATQKIPFFAKKDFISKMIYYGKQLYLKDLFLPNYTDAEKIGYTEDKIKWCTENEEYIWRYFIENELLYSNDQKLNNRFLNPAPFSKFYLEIDRESPGRIAQWIGWQIVRAYAENNKVSLENLLNTNPEELFKKANYKPKKNE